MTRVPYTDRHFSGNLEKTIAHAKIARSQFLKQRFGPLCRIIAQTSLVCAVVALVVYEQPARQVAFDGTVRMDRVAAELARTNVIPPNSVQQMSRLLREPLYDCTQVSCGAALTNRNRVAREKLEAILASASPSLTLSARQTPFGITHVIERSR